MTAPAAPPATGERSFAPPPPHPRRCGFSLIEVTLALLVVGVGVLALLGLFPVGLRESSLATADTSQSIFANGVLSAIHANAGEITTSVDWLNADTEAFTKGLSTAFGVDIKANTVETIVDAYGIPGNIIRYKLDIGFLPVEANYGKIIRYAAIRVSENKFSNINKNPVYYTEFRYEGE